MTPTDFLRAMTRRQRKPVNLPLGTPAEARPYLRIALGADVEQFAQAMRAATPTAAEAAVNLDAIAQRMRRGDELVQCGCWGRYSHCRCDNRTEQKEATA